MELISLKSSFLKDDNDKALWHFFRDAHFHYLITYPIKLNAILNEYLSVMKLKYDLHKDRYREHNGYLPDIYTSDHLTGFQRIATQYVNEISTLNDDFLEMILFYTQLLKYVDRTLSNKFYLGRQFTQSEIKKLIDQSVKEPWIGLCSQKEIMIRVPRNCFGLEGYQQNNNFKGKISYFADDHFIEIIFDNINETFTHTDLWDIKISIAKPVDYYIRWETVNINEVYIYFDAI